MNKKLTLGLWLIGIIFTLTIILFATGIIKLQSGVGGYQVLSLSQVSIINDGTLGKSWLMSISTIPSSFAITGQIKASDVASATSQTPVSDFQINIGTEQELKYRITNTGEQLYDYRMTSSKTFFCILATTPDCPNNAIAGITEYFAPATCQTFCYYRDAHGTSGIIEASPSIPSTITIQVSANGKTSDTTTLQTDKETTGSKDLFVNGKVLGKVFYAGDLVNSAQPRPELFQTYKPINKDGTWFFTPYSAYNTYSSLGASNSVSTMKNTIDSCVLAKSKISGFNKDTATSYMQQCIDSYHNAFVSMGQVSVSGLKEIKADDKSQIYATFTADKLYAFPQLTFLIDTDWVGIQVLKGIPKVSSLSISQECVSGSKGTVNANILNTGNGIGAFDVKMECPSTSILTSVITDNWNPSETKTLKFNFDMNVNQETTQKCTVTATDKYSKISDSKTIDVTCKPTQICVPNQEICDGIIKKKCSPDGTGFGVVIGDKSCESTNATCKTNADCLEGQKCDSSGVCVPLPPIVCEDEFFGLVSSSVGVKEECSFWCQVGLKQPEKINVCVSDYTPLFMTVFTIFALAFLFVFGRKKKGRGKASAINPDNKNWYENKNIWIALGVLLAIGLIIGYFKYVFWGFIALALLGLLYVLIRIFVFKKIW